MIKKTMWIGLAVAVVAFISVSTARADEWNKKTVLTFSQPVEIPGHVLPAGTYTFKLKDSATDRHIVEIYDAKETKLIATVMTIPNYRLKVSDATVIKFREVPAGSPEAIRAWFYPGNTLGREFVYPKERAMALAKASGAPVPAIPVHVDDAEELKAAPMVAITPEAQEAPVATAIQMTPTVVGTTGVERSKARLPKTASVLPLMVLLGLVSIGAAFGLMAFGKRAAGSAV